MFDFRTSRSSRREIDERRNYALHRLPPRAQPAVPVLLDIFQNPIRNPYLRVEVARALGKISSGDGPISRILRAGMVDSVIGAEMRRILRENQTAGQETERVKKRSDSAPQ